MKKILFICLSLGLLAGSMFLFSAAPAPVTLNGCVTSNYYVNSIVYPIYFGKKDTLAGAVTDSLKLSCGCDPRFIKFSNDAWKCAGTPTLTVACYESINGGLSYATTPIATYTITPGSLTAPLTNTYLVNAPAGGNPNTDYVWVATNSASSTVCWQGTVTIRQ